MISFNLKVLIQVSLSLLAWCCSSRHHPPQPWMQACIAYPDYKLNLTQSWSLLLALTYDYLWRTWFCSFWVIDRGSHLGIVFTIKVMTEDLDIPQHSSYSFIFFTFYKFLQMEWYDELRLRSACFFRIGFVCICIIMLRWSLPPTAAILIKFLSLCVPCAHALQGWSVSQDRQKINFDGLWNKMNNGRLYLCGRPAGRRSGALSLRNFSL